MATFSIPPVGPGWQLSALIARYRFSHTLEREVIGILEDAFRAIARQLQQLPELNRRDKLLLAQQFAEIRTLLTEAYGTARTTVSPILREYAALEREIALQQADAIRRVTSALGLGNPSVIAQSIGTSGVSVGLGGVPRQLVVSSARLAEIVEAIDVGGIGFGPWWDRAREDGILRVRRMIQTGIVRGQNPAAIASSIWQARNTGGPNAWRQSRTVLRTAVRTVTTAIQNEAALTAQQSYHDVIGKYRFEAILDARTSDICRPLDGSLWAPNDPKMPVPPLHPNCFPGDALVTASPAITGATSRPFDGELCVIRTSDELVLRSTPNHPVLTPTGWLPAQHVCVGDYLVTHGVNQRVSHAFINHDTQNSPTTIEQVSKLCATFPGVVRTEVKVAAPHFHGDVPVEGEVAVVLTNGGLLQHMLSSQSEQVCDSILGRAPMQSFPLTGLRTSHEPFEWIKHATSRLIRGTRQLLSNVRRRALHARELLRAPVTQGFPSLEQRDAYSANRKAELFVDAAYSDAISKEGNRLTRVVSVETSQFSGHVYNLETERGWYAIDTIITHNCRSTLVPIPNIEGIETTNSPRKSYEQWLREQGPNTQNAILGRGIAEHWRAGKVKLSDLLSVDRRPLSLAQLRRVMYAVHPESYAGWLASLSPRAQDAVLGTKLGAQFRSGTASLDVILNASVQSGVVQTSAPPAP